MSGEERNARGTATACPWCGTTNPDAFLDLRSEDGLHHDCWWHVQGYASTGLRQLAEWLTAFTGEEPLQ